MSSNTKVLELQKQIDELNETRTIHYQSYNRYTIIANSFLEKIEQATAEKLNGMVTDEELEIMEMEKEVMDIDS